MLRDISNGRRFATIASLNVEVMNYVWIYLLEDQEECEMHC